MGVLQRFWNRLSGEKRPIVRIWDDLGAYKKIFVPQGFHELSEQGLVRLEFVPYSYFEGKGAPRPAEAPYFSHKNIVIMEVTAAGKSARIAYDTNDIYYKIPNAILRWVDIYFKSNYQEAYLRTGQLLHDAFWDRLKLRTECYPEPLDASQSAKIFPCSFTMELFPELKDNHRYLQRWAGQWLRTPSAGKPHRLFYLGRWWGESKTRGDIDMLDEIRRLNVPLHGGIIKTDAELPERYRQNVHPAVSKVTWLEMCCESQISLTVRGLDGCMSFKPLNFLMLGSPFIAPPVKSNFWQPLLPDIHYLQVRDDFCDLGEQLEKCRPGLLTEMGKRNLDHWRRYISPEATAQHILQMAETVL